VDNAFRLFFYHLDQNLDGSLKTARHTGSRLTRSKPQNQATNDTGKYGPENGVHIENRKINDFILVMGREMS
jgi:hypothetical protein